MSNIQSRLDELQPYVIGIRYYQKLPLIDVVFKDKWVIPESEIIRKEKGEGDKNYYMFFSEKEGIGIDELLDYAEMIINNNAEREKKNQLFKVKVKELQSIFVNTPLSTLLRMDFIIPTTESEFDSEEITLDIDTVTKLVKKPIVNKPAKKEIRVIERASGNNTKIELPPKKSNGKIELEVHDIAEHLKYGECNCGPEEACDKCMDSKGF